MFNTARTIDRRSLPAKNRGIALLVMLAFILVVFTTMAISRLPQSSGEQKARAKTTQALVQSREAIMAFALAPAISTNPPGRLPCPDTNGDGISDTIAPANIVCVNRRGLVPFVTLGIPQPLDGTGAPIWYAVSTQYTGVLAPVFNSSSAASTLMLNINQKMAFIVLASNQPLTGQVRTALKPTIAMVAQFLEGDNANGTLDSYTDLQSPTQNDQVLGMSMGAFWTAVEGRVLAEVRNSLELYHAQCGVYPFAANYALTGAPTSNDSTAATQEGRLPLGVALPKNWGTACPAPFAANTAPPAPPSWIKTHWGDSLYYAFCPPATPNCLQLVDALGNTELAPAIIMAPGINLKVTARVPGTLGDFYELQNATLVPANTFTHIRPTTPGAFNDLIYIVH